MPGYEHFHLEPPALSSAGVLAFQSSVEKLTPPTVDFKDVIYAGTPGALAIVAREGDIAPGTTAPFETLWDEPLINSAGQLLFSGVVDAGLNNSDGIWVGAPGNIQLLARTGTPLPGLATMLDDLQTSSNVLGNGGHAAFQGRDVNDRFGLWTGTPGNLSLVLLADDPVPTGSGLPPGTTWWGLSAGEYGPKINSTGKLAFVADTDAGPTVWMGAAGSLQLVMRDGMPAPGLPGVEFFLPHMTALINDAGRVAFTATMSTFEDAIWTGTPGQLRLVARGNALAPVGVAGVRFFDGPAFDELRFNNAGQVGFQASLDGPGVTIDNAYALFVGNADDLDMVVRAESQAPELPAGVLFDAFVQYSLNDNGRMAFLAELKGPGVSADNDVGIWAQNSGGVVKLVARTGDWVQPTTGDVVRLADATNPAALTSQGFRQIDELDIRSAVYASGEFGTAWSDDGQIAFSLGFLLDSEELLFVASVDPQTSPGDFDEDGDVDGADFLVWQRSDRTAAGLTAWRTNYGVGAAVAAGASVPEPAGWILGAIAVAFLARRRAIP